MAALYSSVSRGSGGGLVSAGWGAESDVLIPWYTKMGMIILMIAFTVTYGWERRLK